jgi:hypothetical protein
MPCLFRADTSASTDYSAWHISRQLLYKAYLIFEGFANCGDLKLHCISGALIFQFIAENDENVQNSCDLHVDLGNSI